MLQIIVLAILVFALWKLHHDFNGDLVFSNPSSLSDSHVKQALATGRMLAKFGTKPSGTWPRYAERMAAYTAEDVRRQMKMS